MAESKLTPAELAQVEAAKKASITDPKHCPGCDTEWEKVRGADGAIWYVCNKCNAMEVPGFDTHAKKIIQKSATVLLRRVIELEEQLKHYEWTLAETEALVMSHEGHIAKQDAQIAKLKEWQGKALPYLNIAATRFKPSPLDFIRFNKVIDGIERLIAEANT